MKILNCLFYIPSIQFFFFFMFLNTISITYSLNIESLISVHLAANNFTIPDRSQINSTISHNLTSKDIILETINNNPSSTKSLLPSLPKIVTRSGLMCDFPFSYENNDYFDQCAPHKDGLKYCKVHFKTNRGSEMLSKRSELFHNFLDGEKGKLLKIKYVAKDIFKYNFFSECLSIDETERYLNEVVDDFNNYDFKKKLLIELFAKIKRAIGILKQDKLDLLYELAENFCKSTNFNFDCLFNNLILPISKTKDLAGLSKNILAIFIKYKLKLKLILEKSQKKINSEQNYLFITDQNLNSNKVEKLSSDSSKSKSKVNLNIAEDTEDESVISKDLVDANNLFAKISLSQFLKILISILEVCDEECKCAMEFLFIDNFEENIDRIKIEIVSKLFNLRKINEKELIPSILTSDNKRIIYNNHTYAINSQSQRFIDYKNWSIRYLISVLYRYIIIDKLFYLEIIKGKLSDEEWSKILFSNSNNKNIQNQNDQSVGKLIKIVPLLTPYIKYSKSMQKKLGSIYNQSSSLTNEIYNNLKETNKTLSVFKSVTEFLTKTLIGRLNFINNSGVNSLNIIEEYVNEIQNLTEILKQTSNPYSMFKSIALESYLINTENIEKNIYKSEFISSGCHKFLHANSYFDDFAFGKPSLSYIPLTFEPYFFVDFESDVNVFFINGLLNMNVDYKKKYNVTIKSQAKVDLYLGNEIKLPVEVSIFDSDRYVNLTQSVYQIESPGMVNSFRDLLVKGRFGEMTENETYDKHFEFNITNAVDKNINVKIIGTSKNADSKSKENLNELNICFNPYTYKVNCQISCKYLGDKFENNLIEKENINEGENVFYGNKNKKDENSGMTQKAGRKSNQKLKSAIKQQEDMIDKIIKPKKLAFVKTCISYCTAFMWSIPVYKCLNRNIEGKRFESLLIKCGGLGSWNIIARKIKTASNTDVFFKNSVINSINDNLLGKKFLVENQMPNAKLTYIPFMQASYLNPISNTTFIEEFSFDNVSDYMFSSGDMSKFIVLDKHQPFIKGTPYNAFTPYNDRVAKRENMNLTDNHEASIFNLIYNTELMSNKGVVIYNSKYNYTTNSSNSVLFSDNDKFNYNSDRKFIRERTEIFKNNNGGNMFIRSSNFKCLLNTPFFTSNLITDQFYIENTLFTKNIFAFVRSNYLILKVPRELDRKALLLRTAPYQTKYSLNVNIKMSRVYLAIEITDSSTFSKIANKLNQDGWKYLKGPTQMVEIVPSDIGDEIIDKDEYSFYDCSFTSAENPACSSNMYKQIEKIQLGVYYKDLTQGSHDITYSFFDFDDLYGSLHLMFIQPMECFVEGNNLYTYRDSVNNFMTKFEDYLPTYDADINNYIKNVTMNENNKIINYFNKVVKEEKKNETIKLKTNIKNPQKQDKFWEFLILIEKNFNEEEGIKNDVNKPDKNENKTKIKESKEKKEKHKEIKEKLKEEKEIKEEKMNKLNSKNNPKSNLTIFNKKNTSDKNSTHPTSNNNKEINKFKKDFKLQITRNRDYSEPLIKFNQNGCVLSLDRFGNLYHKKLSEIKTQNRKSTWELIQTKITTFDMSENVIITVDYLYNVRMQRGFNLKTGCSFKSDAWVNLQNEIYEMPKIKKLSLSFFNCLWIIDANDNLFHITDTNFISDNTFKLKPVKIDTQEINNIRNIYQYESKIYITTRESQVYVRNNTYNSYDDRCSIGNVSSKIFIIRKRFR